MTGIKILQLAGMIFVLLFFINWICQFGSTVRKFWFGDFVVIFFLGVVIVRTAPFWKTTGEILASGLNLVEFEWRAKNKQTADDLKSLQDDATLILRHANKVRNEGLDAQMKYVLPR